MPAAVGGSLPKRHHYVPQGYLRAWCDAKGHVAVRRRDRATTYPATPVNVGVATHLYGTGLDSLWREKNFSLVEEEWPRLRADLLRRGQLHGRDRDMACMFMALQIARTREHIAQTTFASELAAFTEECPPSRETVRMFIREHHGHEPEDAEVEAAWTLAAFAIMHESPPSFDQAFSIAMEVATTRLAPVLGERHWRVEIAGQPVLWTSDRPVMPWRPPSPRDRFEGVGYADADEIRMPLSPVAMLVLDRRPSQSPSRVSTGRFHHYNADIALQCYEFLVCSPGRQGRLNKIPLARNRPAVRFHVAPGAEVAAEGAESPIGDVIQTWIPLRASDPPADADAEPK